MPESMQITLMTFLMTKVPSLKAVTLDFIIVRARNRMCLILLLCQKVVASGVHARRRPPSRFYESGNTKNEISEEFKVIMCLRSV